jgi:hypothetical protein
VLHVTNGVINLWTDREKLISLVTHSIGNGPHNIVLPLDRFGSQPSPSEPVFRSNGELVVDGYNVDLKRVSIWVSRPDWQAIRAQAIRIHRICPDIKALLRTQTPDPGVNQLFDRVPPKYQHRDHFVDAMVEPAHILITSLRKAEYEQAIDAARSLAGLGTGLTPAGDDFLSGAMMACWSGFCPPGFLQQLPEIIEHAAQLTTRMSAAYLRSAASGEFGVIWHQLLEKIIANEREEMIRILQAVMGIGHNSGAYTLTGFVMLAEEAPIVE